ncbi:unnamed protein product [Urochloa humidicola]
MPDAAQHDDEVWRPWADLPLDLLRDISRRLHAVTDYASFHAACAPWRNSLPPPARRPTFLPWLLSPPDSTNLRIARCVFSSASSRGRAAAATEIWVRDRRWVVSPEDGTAVSTLIAAFPGSSHNNLAAGDLLLTGSAGAAPLPRFPLDDETKWWQNHALSTLSGDGTICAYVIGAVNKTFQIPSLNVAVRRPGCAEWKVVRRHKSIRGRSCIAYHDGNIVVCDNRAPLCIGDDQDHHSYSWPTRGKCGKVVNSHHLLESRGELLLALVLVNCRHYYTYNYHVSLDPDYYTVDSFAKGLLVSVYALQVAEGSEPQWVERDNWSLADRVMFLEHPSSFAMDAARFGDSGGGCAYFVVKNQLFGGMRSKSPLQRCRVFRYNFRDSKSELVEQLPDGWHDEACMWLTPQPFIASTEEIRERLEASQRRAAEPQLGPFFRIFVGNLPRKVDCCQLRRFFSKHGKVADARIMCHIKNKRSRGFGFVTVAAAVNDVPAHVIAKLDGQILDGRPLRVKFADQKEP